MTAALEAAKCGKQVMLVEKSPTLGGRADDRYFPWLSHPCGLEINLRCLKGNRKPRKPVWTATSFNRKYCRSWLPPLAKK